MVHGKSRLRIAEAIVLVGGVTLQLLTCGSITPEVIGVWVGTTVGGGVGDVTGGTAVDGDVEMQAVISTIKLIKRMTRKACLLTVRSPSGMGLQPVLEHGTVQVLLKGIMIGEHLPAL